MKKWLAVLLPLLLTGCAQKIPPESYWTLDVGDTQVSLRDGTAADTVDLVLEQSGVEIVARTLEQGEDYSTAEEIRAWTFEDVLSSNGFVLWTGWGSGEWGIRTYYTVEEGGLTRIAESFGGEDYSVDLDGDGAEELVSNVVYGGDGHQAVIVHQRREDGLWRGRLKWGPLPDHDNWGKNSAREVYDPDRKVFVVNYAVKGQEEPGVLELSGLENVEFYPYGEEEDSI